MKRNRKKRRALRAKGMEQLLGPREQVSLIIEAIFAAQWRALCAGEGIISPGEALARIADHFVETWTGHPRKGSTDAEPARPAAGGVRNLPP